MSVVTAGVGHFAIPTSPAAGTSCTSGAANTYTTTYVQLIASTGAAIYITGIYVEAAAAPGGTYQTVQLATGGAGSETIVGQYLVNFITNTTVATGYRAIFPPIPVANATRIACKTADSVGAKATLITLECINQSNVVDDGIKSTTNVLQWNSSNVSVPAAAGIPDVNIKNMNNVAATSITTINANQGTTQPVNFTGTGASALAKSDMVDVAGAAVSATTAQIGVNVVNWNNTVVATPATAGIPDVNTKNINNVAAATPGAANGILISGSNSGTTTLGALTVTGATTHTGNVVLSDGLTISAPSTGNRAGLDIAGNGTGAAMKLVAGATGVGLSVAAGATSGDGIKVTTTSGHGVNLAPIGTSMHGFLSTGGNGGTSDGIKAAAGTGGVDFRANQTGNLTGNISGSVGSVTGAVGSVTGLTASNLDTTITSRMASYTQPTGFLAATFPSGTVANTTNITAGTLTTVTTATNLTNAPTLSAGDSPVLQSGTATAGGASTITIQTALGADSLPVGCTIKITSGTGAKQSRVITAYVNSTQVVTVDRAWTTNPDNTSVYSILYTESPALSSGLKITDVALVDTLTTYTGNTVQTGDSFGRLGVAGVGLTNLGDTRIAHLDADVSSRMATYTQPTGFLAATFPSGTVANTTNITAGTLTTVTTATTATNLTNAPTAGDFTAAMKTSLNAATPASVTGAVGSVTGAVGSVTGLTASNLDTTVSSRMATYTQPTGFLAATFPSGTVANTTNITAGTVTTATNLTTNNDKTGYSLSSAAIQAIWDALTTALTTASSIGKLLVDNVNATISSRSTYAGADTSGTTTLLGRLTSGRATNLDNLDATVSTRLATSGYTAPDNTSITGIKTKTDSLTFTVAGEVDANVQAVNDITVNGIGTTLSPWGP